MKNLKVVHMTSVHSALDGRIFHKECRSLARAGFQVTVIGPHSKDIVRDDVHIKSVRLYRSRIIRMTRTVWSVYQEARKQQADVYHFHDPELIPVGLLLRANGKSVIYDVHEDMPKDIMSKEYLPEWSRSAVAWVMDLVERSACGRFSGIVAVTPSIAERFLAINRQTIIVRNYPYPKEVVFAQPFSPWETRRPSVAYVGGISALRSIREMVAAMALLPESLPATLELAGNEVPEGVRLEELRSDPGWPRVRHHGLLDQPSTFRLLHQVRAGLVLFHPVPNHIEAMPQKIFEYMGAGIPLIASDFPLWRQILGDTGCAIFVDPLDPRSIAKAIEYILTHPKEAEEMGLLGQAAVLEKYNWDDEAEKLVNLYCGLKASECAA
jgi:glycosyltransferase involved in cell wall biosynthesis